MTDEKALDRGLTDRELDAAVAEAIEPMPPVPQGQDAEDIFNRDLAGSPTYSPGGFWRAAFIYERGDVFEWHPVRLSTSIDAAMFAYGSSGSSSRISTT